MKKVLFIFMLAFTSQVYGFQYQDGSTFVFADLLIWKLREGAADAWAQVITPSGAHQDVKLVDTPFTWNAGFRVGAGYESDNNWDTVIYYTRYQTTGANHVTENSVYSSFSGNFYVENTDGTHFGPQYADASVQWKFLFNTVDLEVGYTFDIDEILILRPFMGLKTAFINQTISTNWYSPSMTPTPQDPFPVVTFTSAQENLKNNYWGIGPSIGLDTTWPMYSTPRCSFNLFGDFSGALMWGHWSFKDIYENNTPISIATNNSTMIGAATMARGLIGLEWSGDLSGKEVAVRLGYEAQVWFNQLQYYSLGSGRLSNLMSLQGGILDFYFNF